jgi:hypothetical protein
MVWFDFSAAGNFLTSPAPRRRRIVRRPFCPRRGSILPMIPRASRFFTKAEITGRPAERNFSKPDFQK